MCIRDRVISDFFHNDDFVTQAKVDDSTTVNTGLLANNLGTDLLTAFKDVQAFEEGPDGPFQGNLTDNQRIYLEGVLANWDSVNKEMINNTARNGMVQTRVDSVKIDLVTRQNSLAGMMGDITDADPVEVSESAYYLRRITDGDLIETAEPAPAAKPKKGAN